MTTGGISWWVSVLGFSRETEPIDIDIDIQREAEMSQDLQLTSWGLRRTNL